MRIPKKLKIRDSTWSVKMDNSITETDNAVGMCDYDTREILLSPDQSRNELEETLVHEILHACWPEKTCGNKLEEKIISQLSPVLYRTLRRNGLLKK